MNSGERLLADAGGMHVDAGAAPAEGADKAFWSHHIAQPQAPAS